MKPAKKLENGVAEALVCLLTQRFILLKLKVSSKEENMMLRGISDLRAHFQLILDPESLSFSS